MNVYFFNLNCFSFTWIWTDLFAHFLLILWKNATNSFEVSKNWFAKNFEKIIPSGENACHTIFIHGNCMASISFEKKFKSVCFRYQPVQLLSKSRRKCSIFIFYCFSKMYENCMTSIFSIHLMYGIVREWSLLYGGQPGKLCWAISFSGFLQSHSGNLDTRQKLKLSSAENDVDRGMPMSPQMDIWSLLP